MEISVLFGVTQALCLMFSYFIGAHGGTFYYMGCFADPSSSTTPDLTGPKEAISSETSGQCIAWCQPGGYPYAGLQLPDYCYCGSSFGNFGSSSNCTQCVGGSNCGGFEANSVYYTVDSDLNSQRTLVVQTDKEDYVKARQACVIYGGDLATTQSVAAINNTIAAIPSNITGIANMWIGLRRRIHTTGPFEWTNANLSPSYNSDVGDFASLWIAGETFSNDCVSLSVSTRLMQTTSCTTALPFVCFQLPPQNAVTDGSITSAPSMDLSADSKKLALFIVLPLFLFCYGGACVLYCVHKIIKNCRGKKMSKMSLDEVKPTINPSLGAREKQPMPYSDNPPMAYPQKTPQRPPSAGKRGMVCPAPMAIAPAYMPQGEIRTKTPVQEFKIIDEEDERPTTTPREVNLLAQSPPPTYADKQEEKRARLLENAAREARERRQKEAEAEGRPVSIKPASRQVTAQLPPPEPERAPSREQEELGPEVTGSTTNLLSKEGDSLRDEDDDQNPAGMSIGEILKMKMAQKAEKKKPRKVIAS